MTTIWPLLFTDTMSTRGVILHHGGRPPGVAQRVHEGHIGGPGQVPAAAPALHTKSPALPAPAK